MNDNSRKYCLATVTCESFLWGTIVMLHSFLKHNPWFEGDIVVIHDFIPPRLQRHVNCFKNVTWLQVGDELKNRVDTLCNGVPHLDLEHKKQRFYSLELFRLEGYRKVLFCDSDILFLDSISELFQEGSETGDLLCCGDLHYYTGTPVDAVTLLPGASGTGGSIDHTFNAGFMLVGEHYLTPHHYCGLLDLLDVERWRGIMSPRTDQVIYNLYFRNRCHLLGAQYNYLLGHADAIAGKNPIPAPDIKVLHFNNKPKPWDCLSVLDAAASRPRTIRWLIPWFQEYLDFLPYYHLQSRLGDRKVKEK